MFALVLQNTLASGIRTRQTCGFLSPIGFAPLGGMERQYNTRKGNTARRLATVLNIPPASLQNEAHKSQQGAIMQTTFTYTPVPEVTTPNRTINTLKRVITETGKWARENGNTELDNAMRDAYGLVVTCWTEIDEGLMQLSQAVRQIERGNPTEAVESIGWAMKYMNRWQDRDGAIGNAKCVTEDELTGLTLEDGRAVPASFASAKIDGLDDLERAVKGLTLVKSVFGLDAKLIVKHHVLNTEALREVWPQLLDRLLAPCPGAIPPKPFDWKASGLLGESSAT